MNDVLRLHQDAMEAAEQAILAKMRGDTAKAAELLLTAYEKERSAATLVENETSAQPTRSVLFRSAASLALDCGLLAEAEQLVAKGLLGDPPAEIADELRDLYEQVSFQRHLDLRGVELEPVEFQFSIAGNAVGFGMASSRHFIGRVEDAQKLLIRTEERCRGKPFRTGGSPSEEVRQDSELYLTTSRAASFAVSFRVGRRKPQLAFDEFSEPKELIDELLDCLELYADEDDESLRARITEEAYYNNFIGLVQRIAPDGEDVKVVGFTAIREDRERRVALTEKRPGPQALPGEPADESKRVTVAGKLVFATAIGKNEIKLVEEQGRKHTVVVPEGMMDDIVKPHWNTRVEIDGIRSKRAIRLLNIRGAED